MMEAVVNLLLYLVREVQDESSDRPVGMVVWFQSTPVTSWIESAAFETGRMVRKCFADHASPTELSWIFSWTFERGNVLGKTRIFLSCVL